MNYPALVDEALLRQERLAALAPTPPTVDVDSSGTILRATRSAAAMLGYRPSDLAGHPLEELTARDWRTTTQIALRSLQREPAGPFALMLLGRGGRPTLIEMVRQPTPSYPASSGEPHFTLRWTARRHSRLMTTSGSSDTSQVERLADAVLRRYEVTRAAMSNDLTDDIASVMTMVRYVIENARLRLANGSIRETEEALALAGEQLRAATAHVQALSSELRPRVLDDLGLFAALAWLRRQFSESHPEVVVSQSISVAEEAIPAAIHVTLFRVVQNALDNVARHAMASDVRLSLGSVDGELRLSVRDNGDGFDVDRWKIGKLGMDGCGLLMIRRWVEASGGCCTFESSLRHGTCIRADWRMASAASRTSPSRGVDVS